MDLKVLQSVVDNLDQLVLKLENMGFDPDFTESIEAMKQAWNDARAFRKTSIVSIFATTALISAVVANFAIGLVVESELAKIEGNKNAIEILKKENVNLKIGSTDGGKMIGVSFEKPLFLSEDHKVVYFEK